MKNTLVAWSNQPRLGAALCNRLWRSVVLLSILVVFSAHAQTPTVLVGSGSSVPAPLYNRWAQEYARHSNNIQLRYLPVGTSEGIIHISAGTGDFGAGEVPLTDKERTAGGLTELPVAIVGIVPIYNLPGVHSEVKLSGEVLAQIFLGDVKNWNSPQIAKLNPGVALPNLPIQVVNRPAGKGSNYVFTDFLSKTSGKFRAQIGVTSSPKWPVGQPAERSADMTEKVKSTPGAIGYVEFGYAVKGNVPQVSVLNAAGKYVKASPDGIVAACKAVEGAKWENLSSSLTNASGAETYPVVSFTWIYLRMKTAEPARATALGEFLEWIYTQGQEFSGKEGYTELPAPLIATAKKKAMELR